MCVSHKKQFCYLIETRGNYEGLLLFSHGVITGKKLDLYNIWVVGKGRKTRPISKLAVIVMNDTDKFEVKKTKILNQII
jgi:hypothetical protein